MVFDVGTAVSITTNERAGLRGFSKVENKFRDEM
jgi:hypothetical protein